MGSLTEVGFGRLVRTVVPGLILLIVIALYVDSFLWVLTDETPVSDAVRANGVVAITIAVPLSVIMGMFSNMVVFIWLNRLVIRKHFAETHPSLVAHESRLLTIAAPSVEAGSDAAPIDYDLDYVAMPRIDMSKWQFLQDSYWSYMEFQLNIFVGLVLALPLNTFFAWHVGSRLGEATVSAWAAALGAAIITSALAAFCVHGARFNYVRHMRKRLSYLTSVLCDDRLATTADPRG